VTARVYAHWFRDLDSERWLSGEEAAFTPIDPTPMGYGLAARPRGEGELDRAGALAQALARDTARRRSPP
jgi:hypothetical protein